MSFETGVAIAANIVGLIVALLTLHHWQLESRRRQDERHEENRDMLQEIRDSVTEMKGKVEILWAWFRARQ